ncbi:hypothetical protein SDC9_174141 [bioreactor metagenome]|uniref:Uncharacterized protein n=1 Tax=bioreactor metagenome TaxID=1076179 RepID=A0A645GKH8_9ZZZZ
MVLLLKTINFMIYYISVQAQKKPIKLIGFLYLMVSNLTRFLGARSIHSAPKESMGFIEGRYFIAKGI